MRGIMTTPSRLTIVLGISAFCFSLSGCSAASDPVATSECTTGVDCEDVAGATTDDDQPLRQMTIRPSRRSKTICSLSSMPSVASKNQRVRHSNVMPAWIASFCGM